MKHRKKNWFKKHTGTVTAIVAVIIIVILFLIVTGGSDQGHDDSADNATDNASDDSYRLNQSELETLNKGNDSRELEEEGKSVNNESAVKEEGLCEDYFFEQGDALKIMNHTVKVSRIASSSLRMNVDGERSVLGKGDAERLGDGIRVSLAENDVVYFGADDPNNAVNLRVGCEYDEDPVDKFVEKKGRDVCKALYEQCQDSFDFDEDKDS